MIIVCGEGRTGICTIEGRPAGESVDMPGLSIRTGYTQRQVGSTISESWAGHQYNAATDIVILFRNLEGLKVLQRKLERVAEELAKRESNDNLLHS